MDVKPKMMTILHDSTKDKNRSLNLDENMCEFTSLSLGNNQAFECHIQSEEILRKVFVARMDWRKYWR